MTKKQDAKKAAKETVGAEEIVNYLAHDGFEVYLGRDKYHLDTAALFAPWKVVDTAQGEEVGRWYEEKKPLKDLAALQDKDPARYTHLMDCKLHSEALGRKYAEIMGTDFPNDFSERRKTYSAYLEQHPEQAKAAEEFKQFLRDAPQDFRPKDYPWDNHWATTIGAGLMYYGLFHNTETNQYLVTMRDRREDFALPRQGRDDSRLSLVEHRLIDGAGRTPESVREEARWLWVEHMLPLLRYTPVTNRTHVKALEEAERLRAKFGSASRGDGSSAKPKRLVFEFFPAFRRAYEGKDGFYRALNDVFGPQGNTRQLHDIGVPHSHAPYGGKEEDAKFGVHAEHFVELYANMNRKDQRDFRAAFNDFAQTLPDLNNADHNFAHSIGQSLSWIAITMRHGKGAQMAPNFLNVMVATEQEFMALAEGRPAGKTPHAARKPPRPRW